MGELFSITFFTAALALLSSLSILPFGVALAWALARGSWRGKALVETLVTLPLVIPPVATGLILLKVFGRNGALGHWLETTLGLEIIFTWKAMWLAAAVMSFPLLVRQARVAFEGVNPRLEQVARTLGAGPWRVFFTLTLPLARRGVIAGALLSFARALGEFGATIMIAGYVTGSPSTLALSIYHRVQLGDDRGALVLLALSILLAFGAVWASERLLRRPDSQP